MINSWLSVRFISKRLTSGVDPMSKPSSRNQKVHMLARFTDQAIPLDNDSTPRNRQSCSGRSADEGIPLFAEFTDKSIPFAELPQKLRELATTFRGIADSERRQRIAQTYAAVVESLIQSGTWKEMPVSEARLPDEFMPEAFFHFWSLDR